MICTNSDAMGHIIQQSATWPIVSHSNALHPNYVRLAQINEERFSSADLHDYRLMRFTRSSHRHDV